MWAEPAHLFLQNAEFLLKRTDIQSRVIRAGYSADNSQIQKKRTCHFNENNW